MSDTPYEHPGEGTDEQFFATEAALDAYARGDTAEGDRLAKLAHDMERDEIDP